MLQHSRSQLNEISLCLRTEARMKTLMVSTEAELLSSTSGLLLSPSGIKDSSAERTDV